MRLALKSGWRISLQMAVHCHLQVFKLVAESHSTDVPARESGRAQAVCMR